ncbi:MAG: hypothetical protein ACI4OR_04865 [Alphaproteobacteria bacterium]
MKNTKKLLYSLYGAGFVLGASALSGCCQTRYVYLNADGTPAYNTPTYTPPQKQSSFGSTIPSQIISGILQGLSGL